MVKTSKITVRKRRLFAYLMEHFNRTPRIFRYKFSKLLNKPDIDKTASLAGFPVFIGKVSIGKY